MYKNLIRLCAAGLLAFNTSAMASVAFDITGPTAVDVDTPSLTPTEVNFNVLDTGTITSLGVRLGLTSYWDNMFVSLSHLGTTVVLMDLQSDSNDAGSVLDAVFQDGAANALTAGCGTPLCSGTFDPLESLSAFNGLELSGQWTFTIYDDEEPGDSSTLDSSSLFGTVAGSGASVPVPAPLALLALGLMGVVSRLRKQH